MFNIEFLIILISNTSEPISTKDIIGWIVTFVSVGVAAFGSIYTGKSYRQDSNAKFIEIFKEMDNEITKLENNKERKNPKKRLTWESNCLNALDRYSSIFMLKRLPSDIIDHFQESFSYALYIINNSSNSKSRQSFSKITDLCIIKNGQKQTRTQTLISMY